MQSRSSSDALGVDVSHWQGSINWMQVKHAGIAFAYIKATEAADYADPQYTVNAHGASSAGILHGAYHFARPGASASADAQADYFVKHATVNGSLGELPPALDLEDAGGLSKSALTTWVRMFVNRVQTRTGRTCILYVSPSFATSNLEATLNDIPLWAADWGVSEPANFNGWTKWLFWQYSDQGHISGISGPVDRDAYAGNLSDLRSTAAASGNASVSKPSAPPRSQTPGSSSGSKSSNGSSAKEPMLALGATGAAVKRLQVLLYRAGKDPGVVDGIFGSNTQQSVESFQRMAGIAQDGIVGPVTWSHLTRAKRASRPLLRQGSTGPQVQAAQYLLQYHHANPGVADSIFGPHTEAAVRRFQQAHHLQVDGIIGPHTWNALTQP